MAVSDTVPNCAHSIASNSAQPATVLGAASDALPDCTGCGQHRKCWVQCQPKLTALPATVPVAAQWSARCNGVLGAMPDALPDCTHGTARCIAVPCDVSDYTRSAASNSAGCSLVECEM
eukprot:scaffold122121_cov24-Tisochrysis_lutea.AAC.3